MTGAKPNPWDWLNPHDIARFGDELLDPAVRQRWCAAILTGGLPLMWRKSAAPVRDMMFDKLELQVGERVLLIGESNESCGFLDALRARVGDDGVIDSIDVIEQGRTKSIARERGRGGQIGTWQYDYTFDTASDSYDAVAVLQGVQHSDDWRETATDLVRVLKPGRMIVLGEITFGPNFTNLAKLDLHLEYYIDKLFRGAGFSGAELAYYSPDELMQAFDGLVEQPETFAWRGLELFWGRKPQP